MKGLPISIFTSMALLLALVACGPAAAEQETATPPPGATSSAASPTPYPTYTPLPTYTPYPTATPVLGTPTPTPTLAPTPTPTPEPTPTPLPKYRAVDPPEVSDLPTNQGGDNIIEFTSGPTVQNGRLSLSYKIVNKDLPPTAVQLWQGRYHAPYGECTSDMPVAFIRPGPADGDVVALSSYEWTFCHQGYVVDTITQDVPWLGAKDWRYSERDRNYTTEPRIWDFRLSVDITADAATTNYYGTWEGWRVIIWSGETMLAHAWVGR